MWQMVYVCWHASMHSHYNPGLTHAPRQQGPTVPGPGGWGAPEPVRASALSVAPGSGPGHVPVSRDCGRAKGLPGMALWLALNDTGYVVCLLLFRLMCLHP